MLKISISESGKEKPMKRTSKATLKKLADMLLLVML